MEKKKIVHIAQSAGGVENYIYMLLKQMDKNKHTNILLVSEDYKKDEDRFKDLVEQIYYVPMKRDINLKSILKSVKVTKKLLKEIKPDVVYMHSSMAGGVGRIATLFNHKAKKIYNAHGWYFNAEIGNKKRKMYEIIERILAKNTDMIVNISQSEYDSAIVRKIAKPEKMCLINNGIDFSIYEKETNKPKDIRERYKIKDTDILIGSSARISEQKDPITFIKAAKRVYDKYNNTYFMFIGAGELEKEVLDYAEKNNFRDRVIITGWVENYDEYTKALDIAILPSKWEGFGLAILDYMAAKKPIVASNVGGIPNIITSEDKGILVESGNVDGFAEAIEDIIKNYDKYKQKAEENYTYAKSNFDIKNVYDEHEKIL